MLGEFGVCTAAPFGGVYELKTAEPKWTNVPP